jgi:hypothetical protein
MMDDSESTPASAYPLVCCEPDGSSTSLKEGRVMQQLRGGDLATQGALLVAVTQFGSIGSNGPVVQ